MHKSMRVGSIAPPRWAPPVIGVGTAILVVLLWLGLERREQTQQVARAQIAANAVHRAVNRQFESITASVSRLSQFVASATVKTAVFGNTVTRLVAETDGLTRLLLVDSTATATRSAPDDGMQPISPQLADRLRQMMDPLNARGDAASPFVAPTQNDERPIAIGLLDSPTGIAILHPLASRVFGVATVVALIDERELLTPFTTDSSAGFVLRALVNDSLLVGPPLDDRRPTLVHPMHFGTRTIRLSVTPLPTTGASALPDLVLALGLAIAALLALTLWLARKAHEQASTMGMTRMQRAIERATDGVWELDLQQGRAYRSEALLHNLGLDPKEINGAATIWNARVHPEDMPALARALDAHTEGRTDAFECVYRLRAGDDQWHTIVDRGRVIERARDGRPLRLLGISADTTERARADSALEESERRFRAMFDTAYQLQLLLDLDGSILEVNRAAAELADTDVDGLQGQRFSALRWWPDDPTTRARVEERFARARSGESNRFEVELTGAGDRRAFVDFSLKAIVDHEQVVVQVLAEGRDLTERKRAEASLREIGALTTMGQLAARVAHEINNPLAGIQNAFLLVRGAIPSDHPHFRFVGAIEREIARIAAVTRQLYETYRPDQSMGEHSSVILAISDAVTFLEQVNRARQVRIVTDVSAAPSLVPVPDALLRQTLYNLVQNALDASPTGGTITVTAVHKAPWCVIRVTDEGPGVPEAIRRRIFDPFFSTKDRSVKTGGMGIGLSLVRQSVLAVGGEIDVRDRAGGGTEFEVRLPMTPIDTGVLR